MNRLNRKISGTATASQRMAANHGRGLAIQVAAPSSATLNPEATQQERRPRRIPAWMGMARRIRGSDSPSRPVAVKTTTRLA